MLMNDSGSLPALYHPLSQNSFDPVAEDGKKRDMKLSNLGNGELPQGAPPAATIRASGTLNCRLVYALLIVTAAGCVTYWTFGRPIFGSMPHGNAGPVTGSSGSGGRIVNWSWIDQVMRKSYG